MHTTAEYRTEKASAKIEKVAYPEGFDPDLCLTVRTYIRLSFFPLLAISQEEMESKGIKDVHNDRAPLKGATSERGVKN